MCFTYEQLKWEVPGACPTLLLLNVRHASHMQMVRLTDFIPRPLNPHTGTSHFPFVSQTFELFWQIPLLFCC